MLCRLTSAFIISLHYDFISNEIPHKAIQYNNKMDLYSTFTTVHSVIKAYCNLVVNVMPCLVTFAHCILIPTNSSKSQITIAGFWWGKACSTIISEKQQINTAKRVCSKVCSCCEARTKPHTTMPSSLLLCGDIFIHGMCFECFARVELIEINAMCFTLRTQPNSDFLINEDGKWDRKDRKPWK